MSSNKYDSYLNRTFTYSYPYEWERHNREYLKKFEDRPRYRDYIDPSVFRIRFYQDTGELLLDNFYSSALSVYFPRIEDTETKQFIGWSLLYNNENVIINSGDYNTLTEAVNNDYTDLKLTATYKEI